MKALDAMAAHLRRYRETQRLTLVQMAEQIGVSRTTYIRMERAKPGVRVGDWVTAWTIMSVVDEVVDATEPNLFEALIEKEFPDY